MRSILLALALTTACNRAPEGPEVALGPDAPTTTDDLILEVLAGPTDRNNKDEPVITVAWTRDGQSVDDLADALTVPASRTSAGEVWEATVGATDGRKDAVPVALSTTIENTAPTVTVALAPDAPSTTDDLVASVEVDDIDGDELTVTWSWLVDGVKSGETGDTVAADGTSKNQTWQVTATVSDPSGAQTSASAEVTVLNSTPSVAGARVEPSRLYTDSEPSCIGIAWRDADGDEELYETTWKVNGRTAGTGDTLDSSLFKRGDTLGCVLTPVDDESAGASVESFAPDILNSQPVILTYTVDPDEPTVDGRTEARILTWYDLDGDSPVPAYSWYVNGELVSEASFLRGEEIVKGDEVHVRIQLFDGIELGPGRNWVRTVPNTPPTAPVVSITPSGATPSDDLTCSLDAESIDVDGDVVTYSYAWSIGGTTVGTEETLPSSSTSSGDSVTCTATPHDGDEPGAPGTATISL